MNYFKRRDSSGSNLKDRDRKDFNSKIIKIFSRDKNQTSRKNFKARKYKQKSAQHVSSRRFRFRYFLLFSLVTCFLLASLVGYICFRFNQVATTPNDGSSSLKLIVIPEGSSLKAVSAILEKNQLIHDSKTFEMYTRLNKKENTIRAGNFQLAGNLAYDEILTALTSPIVNEVEIRIPEGKRFTEFADIIAETLAPLSENWNKNDFLEICNNPHDKKRDTKRQINRGISFP